MVYLHFIAIITLIFCEIWEQNSLSVENKTVVTANHSVNNEIKQELQFHIHNVLFWRTIFTLFNSQRGYLWWYCWSHFIYSQHNAKNVSIRQPRQFDRFIVIKNWWLKHDDSWGINKNCKLHENWVAPFAGSPLESIKYSAVPNDRLHRMYFSNGVDQIFSSKI